MIKHGLDVVSLTGMISAIAGAEIPHQRIGVAHARGTANAAVLQIADVGAFLLIAFWEFANASLTY